MGHANVGTTLNV